MTEEKSPELYRHFGILEATALNVTGIVGAGVFVTIPLMLDHLPGPYALIGWIAAGILMLADGLVWSELGAMFPGSGGSYLYLRETYGRDRWGRLMGFLFIWQFLVSGPLETASGLIAVANFSQVLAPAFANFSATHSLRFEILKDTGIAAEFSPARLVSFLVGTALVALAYRKVRFLARMTMTFWIGILLAIGWIIFSGLRNFDSSKAFDNSPIPELSILGWSNGIGATMILAMYSYLGYYNVCYIGDEVREPAKTIPRAIILSSILVALLFIGVHLSMLGTISWREIPTKSPEVDHYNLPAHFLTTIHGSWAGQLIAGLLIWSCIGSAFSQLVSYSRIPFGAARDGHFFSVFARVHPTLHIPHVSLLLVGGLTLFWSFFDLSTVINALLVTRVLEQFIGQIIGLWIFRQREPKRDRPFSMWLYPLPSFIALAGWAFIYLASGWAFILLGFLTLSAGGIAFLAFSYFTRQWPFAGRSQNESQVHP